MRKRMLPLAYVILPLLWSCGPKHTELVKVVNWSADESFTWKGRPREELLAVLGRPSLIKPDGKGGEVYSYERIKTQGYGTDFPYTETGVAPPSEWSLVPASSGLNPDFPKQYVVDTKAIATFWIDEDGVVYEQWIRTGLKKKTQVFLKPRSVP